MNIHDLAAVCGDLTESLSVASVALAMELLVDQEVSVSCVDRIVHHDLHGHDHHGHHRYDRHHFDHHHRDRPPDVQEGEEAVAVVEEPLESTLLELNGMGEVSFAVGGLVEEAEVSFAGYLFEKAPIVVHELGPFAVVTQTPAP